MTFRVTSTLTAPRGAEEEGGKNEVRMNVSMERVQLVVLLPFVEELSLYLVANGGLLQHLTNQEKINRRDGADRLEKQVMGPAAGAAAGAACEFLIEFGR